MKSVRLVQIFCPVKETNRTHSKGYVEDSRAQRGQKRCAKMMVLNLSVVPKFDTSHGFSFSLRSQNKTAHAGSSPA